MAACIRHLTEAGVPSAIPVVLVWRLQGPSICCSRGAVQTSGMTLCTDESANSSALLVRPGMFQHGHSCEQ